ncbi:MAG: FKBP-type peptidyl-prolyl cis-trans isomerase [Bacteroidetes bacterium]|nr:FKBP-type peptidyl-prolyl cis-trans isomerase [Bacteroidota bacterium]
MKISFSKAMLTIAAGVVVTFSACKNSPYPGYDLDESNGMYSKFYTQNKTGVKPVEGDVVRISLVVKTATDSVLTDSKDPKFNRSGSTYFEFPLMKPEFKGSLEEALTKMFVGDSASFLISVDSMYKSKEVPPFLKKGTVLKFEVGLQKITPKAEADAIRNKKMEEQKAMMEMRKNEEPKILAKYLADNKINAKATATGLYYIETKKGNGKKPKVGELVTVNYTGRLLDGTIFDTSDEKVAKASNLFDERNPYKPYQFPLGQNKVIPGWEEGLMLMSVGSKGQLIVPSSLAYGAQGGGPIPPFSPLVFDVELMDVSTAPPVSGPKVIQGQKVN